MISESGLNKSRLICGARMLTSLLKWSFVRHRYLFIAFTMVQTVFALAIVYGLTLMMEVSPPVRLSNSLQVYGSLVWWRWGALLLRSYYRNPFPKDYLNISVICRYRGFVS